MKRLLLPLLAAFALPVLSGDLGPADFETSEANKYEITEKDDRSQDFGQMRCGFRNKIVKCSVKFINGRLMRLLRKILDKQKPMFQKGGKLKPKSTSVGKCMTRV